MHRRLLRSLPVLVLAWLLLIVVLAMLLGLGSHAMPENRLLSINAVEGAGLESVDCAAMEARARERNWPGVVREAPPQGWSREPLAVAVWGLPSVSAVIRHGDTLTCGTLRNARHRDPRFQAGVGSVLVPAAGDTAPVEVLVSPSFSSLWPPVVHVGSAVDALQQDNLRWMLRVGVCAGLLVLLLSTLLAFGSTRPTSMLVFAGATVGFLAWALEMSAISSYPVRWLVPERFQLAVLLGLPLPVVAGFARSLLIQADVQHYHRAMERLSLALLWAALATLPLLLLLPRTAALVVLPAAELLPLLLGAGVLVGAATVWRRRHDTRIIAGAVVPFVVVTTGSLMHVQWVLAWKIELLLLCGFWLALISHLVAAQRQSRVNRDLVLMKRLASTDDLTGLPNRRAVQSTLELEYARARALGASLPLAVIDLDHFKRINDSYGHPVGDQVLAHFASAVRPLVRRGDLIGRTGGEEFVLLLPGASMEGAVAILEALRDGLAAPFEVAGHRISLGFSAGLTDAACHAGPDAALHVADALLYRAKDAGRGRTECDVQAASQRTPETEMAGAE